VKLLYDWLVLPPAVVIDYALYCLFGIVALVTPSVAWHCTVKLIDESRIDWKGYPARPRRAITWAAAIVISLYVAIVCVAAIYELPRAFHWLASHEDPD
jgi:hypothetical protein